MAWKISATAAAARAAAISRSNSNSRTITQQQEGKSQDNARLRSAAAISLVAAIRRSSPLVRRDSAQESEALWVINSLANPRPTLETYSYAMPGEANMPQAHLEIFDVAIEGRN